MIYKVTTHFLAIFFLSSSVVLPLGDFSLLQDIPQMYYNYTKLTADEEMGVVDFIGDYLMHGKDLFGHNEHDKIPVKGCDVQFQHQASPTNVVFNQAQHVLFSAPVTLLGHPPFYAKFYFLHFRNKLFRPPLS